MGSTLAHGHRQLSLFNAHYEERCFSPIHIYNGDIGHCVLTVLRPGKKSAGNQVRAHLRRLVRHIRMHWPETRIAFRGDSHYGRREAMDWCEKNGVRYIFGLSGGIPQNRPISKGRDLLWGWVGAQPNTPVDARPRPAPQYPQGPTAIAP